MLATFLLETSGEARAMILVGLHMGWLLHAPGLVQTKMVQKLRRRGEGTGTLFHTCVLEVRSANLIMMSCAQSVSPEGRSVFSALRLNGGMIEGHIYRESEEGRG
jgi:hypothetical protein